MTKNRLSMITVDKKIRKIFEKIDDKEYYRFSSKLDNVHLVLPNDSLSFCGKPLIGENYARYKPTGTICEDCVTEIKNIMEIDNSNDSPISKGILDKNGKVVYIFYISTHKNYALVSYSNKGDKKFKTNIKNILDERTKESIEIK